MTKPLLIEIGVEELPALPLLKELPNIPRKWEQILEEQKLKSPFHFYYTPRRLVFWHTDFALRQPDTVEEFYGAPVEIAFKENQPTPAALGFAKKCGISVEELQRATKNGKEVLYYRTTKPGKPTQELLPGVIEAFLHRLNFGKSMRWGDLQESFIRPIRWIGAMLGEETIAFECYGVRSGAYTYGHRTLSYAPIAYKTPADYFEKLSDSGVILDPSARRSRILEQFGQLEREGYRIERDEDLLEEVVAITEMPTALSGAFDPRFLALPPEVIVTSMKEHQRYFPLFEKGKLANRFIVVSNAITDDFSQIVEGNQKVLRARLSDALFFYENDLQRGLSPEGLKEVTYMQELGSIYDKELREKEIALYLYRRYADRLQKFDSDLLERTVMLTKADLLTDMVYEFPELQGIMGYYYAKAAGEEESLAIALKEQYLPEGEESALPSNDFSAVVAMSGKLDTILALFAIGKIPTGTKDPFAMRRAALGIIKIVLDREFAFDLREDLQALAQGYADIDLSQVEAFFIERLTQYLKVNPSVIQAVLSSNERNILEIYRKTKALDEIVSTERFKPLHTTFKRVANIIKDLDMNETLSVDPALFEKEAEVELYRRFKEVDTAFYPDYGSRLQALFGLKKEIDRFFDEVLVNAKDPAVMHNRKHLIGQIYEAFKQIADIKEITG